MLDKTPPTATVTYSTMWATSGNVIATITLSETGTVTNKGWLLSYTFTENGSFVFEFVDEAGNTGNVTATVTRIDKVLPIITLSGANPITLYVWDTYTDAWATWSDNVDGSGTLVWSWIVNTSIAGTYTIIYTKTDSAGNTSTAYRTVNIYQWNGWGWWGWGWWSLRLEKDTCPDDDYYSSSYYDKTCWIAPKNEWKIHKSADI